MNTQPLIPDQDVRREIISRHEVNFVVIAGAGTGKTRLLIDKVMAMLEAGRVALGQLAAITYTEKAAAEMASRLRLTLEARLAAGEDPEGRFSQARDELDSAAITTLHGFAGRLLRERPVEVHLSPDHRVMDQVQSDLLFEDLFDRWEAEQLSEERDTWQRLIEHGLDAHLRDLARDLAGNTDVVADHHLPSPPPPSALQAAFLEAVTQARERLGELVEETLEPQDKAAVEARELLAQLKVLVDEPLEDPFALIPRLEEVKPSLNVGSKKNWPSPESLEEVRQCFRAVRAAVDALKAGCAALLAQDATTVLSDFLERYEAAKQERGVVDFQDLLIKARNLLRDFPEARRAFQERYQVLMVDEFQDTDPLQAEILFFLAEEGAVASRWEEVRLAPGRLFIVGDPKQSIYRFRRADVEVFEAVRERICAQGGLERTLITNFRSLPGVVQFVNATFGQLIKPPAEGGRYQPSYDPLVAARLSPHAEVLDRARIELMIHGRDELLEASRAESSPSTAPSPAKKAKGGSKKRDGASAEVKGFNADFARELEADFIARRLKQMLNGEYLVSESREVSSGTSPEGADSERSASGRPLMRPVRAGDIAILFQRTTQLDTYTNALRDQGIPFRVVGSPRFFAAPEIIDLSNLLRAIVAPHDTLALVATLRSPAFGVTDAELTALQRAGALDFRAPLEPKRFPMALRTGFLERIREIFDTLLHLHDLRDRVSMPMLVGLALTRTHLWSVHYSSFGGEQRALNLDKVRSMARMYELAGMRSFNRFVETLLEGIKGQRREEEFSDSEESDDQVRIMTIHKAKGLEWPVVVLPGLMTSQSRMGDFLDDREQASYGYQLTPQARTINFEALKEREKPRLLAERLRLFYVAATRARDYLLMTGVHTEREVGSLLDDTEEVLERQLGIRWRSLFEGILSGTSEAPERRALEKAAILLPKLGFGSPELSIGASRRDLILDALEPPKGSPSGLVQEVQSLFQATLAEDEAARSALPDEIHFHVPRPSLLAHRALTLLEPGGEVRAVVDKAAALLTWERHRVSSGMKVTALSQVEAFLRGDIGRRFLQSVILERNIPLTFRTEAGLSVTGSLDLVGQVNGHSPYLLAFLEELTQEAVSAQELLAIEFLQVFPGVERLILVSLTDGAYAERMMDRVMKARAEQFAQALFQAARNKPPPRESPLGPRGAPIARGRRSNR